MSVGTLTFELPEEREEFRAASNASLLSYAIYEIDLAYRNAIKYNEDLAPEAREALDWAREIIRQELSTNCLEWTLDA